MSRHTSTVRGARLWCMAPLSLTSPPREADPVPHQPLREELR